MTNEIIIENVPDKANHSQGDPDVSIPSTVVLETHYEHNSTIFFSDSALNAIEEYNAGKTIASQNCSSKKLLVDNTDAHVCGENGDVDWNYIRLRKRFSMPPLCLFHIIQWLTAQRRADEPSRSELMTIKQLEEACGPHSPCKNTIRSYLEILEEANLIAIEKVGPCNCVRVADEKLGPVFETYYQSNTEPPHIDVFDPAKTSVQFPVGPTSSIVDSARQLFYDEVRAGMVLLGLFVLYTALYVTMLRNGYPFVEGAAIQYSLTLMGLVGGFALGVGLLRRAFASVGLRRLMF